MTEYWVSQPKHYCKVCRIYIDAKPGSVKRHETGTRHQSAFKEQQTQKRKAKWAEEEQQRELKKEIEAIEKAARQSYDNDVSAGIATALQRKKNKTYFDPKDPGYRGDRPPVAEDGSIDPNAVDYVSLYNQKYGHGASETQAAAADATLQTVEQVVAAKAEAKKGEEAAPDAAAAAEAEAEAAAAAAPRVDVDEHTGFGKWQTVSVEEQQTRAQFVRTEEQQRALETQLRAAQAAVDALDESSDEGEEALADYGLGAGAAAVATARADDAAAAAAAAGGGGGVVSFKQRRTGPAAARKAVTRKAAALDE